MRSMMMRHATMAVLIAAALLPAPGGGGPDDTGAFTLEKALARSVRTTTGSLKRLRDRRKPATRSARCWGMLWPQLSTDVAVTRLGAGPATPRISTAGPPSSRERHARRKPGGLVQQPERGAQGLYRRRQGGAARQGGNHHPVHQALSQPSWPAGFVKLYTESVNLLGENLPRRHRRVPEGRPLEARLSPRQSRTRERARQAHQRAERLPLGAGGAEHPHGQGHP